MDRVEEEVQEDLLDAAKSFNKINGLHPTKVNVPPRIAEKPMGISNRDRGISNLLLIRCIAGGNNAAAPIFCMKLEMPATVS